MSGKAKNSKVKALQHQNDSMINDLQTLHNKLIRLQESLRSHEAEASKHGRQSQPGPDPETTKTLQFISDEYNDLIGFCKAFKKDLGMKSCSITGKSLKWTRQPLVLTGIFRMR